MKLKLTRNQIVVVGVAVVILVVFVAILIIFRRPSGGGAGGVNISGDITVWGVFDDDRVFRQVIQAYKLTHPNVSVTYIQKDPGTYEQELINTLATPNAPDVFMFHNTWLPKHIDKIQPLVPSAMPVEQYRQLFPDTVSQDFAPDGVIYAFPLYLDTLALFYNEDIFDQNGIALPPSTWEEFLELIPKLREVDTRTGRISQAAAAIGGSDRSINRASDILGLLMLQTGTQMVAGGVDEPSFNSPQGEEALAFYTSFADPRSQYYTWDDAFSYSIDSFASEDTAMMFNYQHQIPLLQEKNPFLDFAVAPVPQPADAERDVNYPNYWGLAVAAKSQSWRVGWNFILSLSRDPDVTRAYLQASGRPPAHRSLISESINDPDLEIFARQALTARSWPQVDNVVVENAFSEMIRAVLSGRPPVNALNEAQSTIRRAGR